MSAGELSSRIHGLSRERQRLWSEMSTGWSADIQWRVRNIGGLLEDAYAEKRQEFAVANGRPSAEVKVGFVVRGLHVEGVGSRADAE